MLEGKVWNGLLFGNYIEIAQELTENEEKRKWVAIYNLNKLNKDNTSSDLYPFLLNGLKLKGKFIYISFFMSKLTLEISDGVDDRDIEVECYKIIYNEQSLEHFLNSENIDPNEFLPPWRCDYPL